MFMTRWSPSLPTDVLEHHLVHLDGVDLTGRANGAGKRQAEAPRAGSQIGHDGSWLELQLPDDLVDAKAGDPLRRVEQLDPFGGRSRGELACGKRRQQTHGNDARQGRMDKGTTHCILPAYFSVSTISGKKPCVTPPTLPAHASRTTRRIVCPALRPIAA